MPAIRPSLRTQIQGLQLAKPIAANLVAQRSSSLAEASEFLKPATYADFMKQQWPALCKLHDVEAAATRLADAVEKGQPIGISGDYDCDGNCSVALMSRFLMQSGVPTDRIHVHIPNRELEGYGVNEQAVAAMIAADIKLLLTLDNGTSAYGPIRQAAASGLDVIVADHHGNYAKDGLPNALVINPNRHDETSALAGIKDMAAVSVTFLLCARAAEILEKRGHYQRLPEPALRKPPNPKDWLGLVAMATVGDVVNVKSPINRMLVKEGLNIINQKRDPYLTALAESAQIPLPITEESIAFSLAPIINAPGRLGQSIAWAFLSGMAGKDASLEKTHRRKLFRAQAEIDQGRTRLNPSFKPQFSTAIADDNADYSAQEKAAIERQNRQLEKLEKRFGTNPDLREARMLMLLSKQCNEERKALESELLGEARAQARQWLALHPDSGTILVAGQGWHPGLIGIVAGRLKEELSLPVVVGSIDAEGTHFKCSARSIKSSDGSVHIGHCFQSLRAQGIFDKAGGHAMAAGGSIDVAEASQMAPRLDALRLGMERELGSAAHSARDDFRLKIAGVLDLKSWQQTHGKCSTPALCEAITDIDTIMRPYGEGNPRPVFAIANSYIANISRSRDGKHLFFDVQQPGCDITLPAVAFHVAGTPLEQALLQGRHQPIHVAGTLSVRESSQDASDGPAIQLRLEDACLANKLQQDTIGCLETATRSAADRAGILASPKGKARA